MNATATFSGNGSRRSVLHHNNGDSQWRTDEITRDIFVTRKTSVTYHGHRFDGNTVFACLQVAEEGSDAYELLVPLDTRFGDLTHWKSTRGKEKIEFDDDVKLHVLVVKEDKILLNAYGMRTGSHDTFFHNWLFVAA